MAEPDPNTPDWRLVGDWWDLCNCAIGCPCNFGSDPTLGYCEGVLTWLIREGNYGDLRITKDLAVVLVIHWEGNVFEKNREFGFLIDDCANPAEREALQKIFTGYAGGAFAAWRDLTLSLDGVEFVPMTVTHDAENWRVEVPGMVEGLGGPFRKYMVPDGDTCRIYNAPRPEVVPGFLTVGTAKRNVVTGAFGRKWDWSNRSSKHIAFDLNTSIDVAGWPRDKVRFDLIVCAETIEHLHTPPEFALMMLGSLLKPDGLLLVTTPNACGITRRLKLLFGTNPFERIRYYSRNPGHFREYTRDEMIEMGGTVGLDVRECRTINFYNQRLALVDWLKMPAPFRDSLAAVYAAPR